MEDLDGSKTGNKDVDTCSLKNFTQLFNYVFNFNYDVLEITCLSTSSYILLSMKSMVSIFWLKILMLSYYCIAMTCN